MPAACLGLLLLVAVLYARTAGFAFVNLDDGDIIYNNPHVMGGLGWDNIRWAFAWGKASYWHPLTFLSFMLDATLFDATPGGVHLENALFHGLNAVLVLLFFLRTTGRFAPSLAVAALFAVHPLHVESVAWAVERKDVLYAFFWLLSLHLYVWYTQADVFRSRLLLMAGSCLCLLLGLMAKPMPVTAPFLLLLLDIWPLGRWTPVGADGIRLPPARLVMEKLPQLAVAASILAISFLAIDVASLADNVSGDAIPFSAYVANALVAYIQYIVHMVWPANLAVIYPFDPDLPLWQPVAAALVLLAGSAAALWQLYARPWIAVGWFWFLGVLIPVIGIVRSGLLPAWADRFGYFPLLGLYAALAFTTYELWGASPRSVVRRAHLVCWLAAILALSGVAWHQIGFWKNTETLYARALQVTPGHTRIWNNLAVMRSTEGRMEEALTLFTQSLDRDPRNTMALVNSGLILIRLGRAQEAESRFHTVLGYEPANPDAIEGLAKALLAQGKPEQALAVATRGLQWHSQMGALWLQQGVALAVLNRPAEAEQAYRQAFRCDTTQGEPMVKLGNLLFAQGRAAEALRAFQTAEPLFADKAPMRFNIALCLNSLGREQEAASLLRDLLNNLPLGSPLAQRARQLLTDWGPDTATP